MWIEIYLIAVPRVLFDLSIEKKLFNQDLRSHSCTAASIDYLL